MRLLEEVERLFEQFGYLVLVIGLPLDFIALPIPPGNTTLTLTGYMSYIGSLNLWLALAAALTGALSGVTITYFIGYKLGAPLIEKYGKYLSIKPSTLEKTRSYYNKYGNILLLFAFFLPGIRQFIGYFIGIIRIPYHTVVRYAYAGTALWVVFFFSIGYLFGEQWKSVFQLVERYFLYFTIILVVVLIGYIIYRWRANRSS